ncbi:MAG: hypothetical protein HY696_07725 [Deltaproteobacteria bacterium]|nr:hypothetical protein [Deltaproteobacteria bacterium]
MRNHTRWGCVALLWLAACGGGDDDSSTASCTGVSAFSGETAGFTLTIPDGSLSSCQNASPTLGTSDTTTDAVESDETLLSPTAYTITLNTTDNTAVEANGTFTLSIPFDGSSVPAAHFDDAHIYANIVNPDNETLLSVFGTVGDSALTLDTTGLPANSKWVVVYNPNIESIIYTPPAAAESLPAPGKLTAQPSVFGNWPQNQWCVVYNSHDATLRTTIATAQGVAANTLTANQMNTFLQEQVSKAAYVAGLLYQDGNFRAPNLAVYNSLGREARKHFCTGTDTPFYNIIIDGRSRFTPPWHNYGPNPFGVLYIGSSEVADKATDPLGSALDAVAHEMAHAIFAGYDLVIGDLAKGIKEGTATTLGSTMGVSFAAGLIDTTSARWSTIAGASVRSAHATETHLLSNRVNVGKITHSEAYGNQDFFAYLANRFNGGDLSYLADTFDALYEALNPRASAAGFSTIWGWDMSGRLTNTILYTDLSTALDSALGDDLATLYAQFALDRAYDHPAAAVLRSGDPATASLNAALFAASAIASVTYTPTQIKNNEAAATGSFADIPPFASRVLSVAAGEATTEDRSLQIALTELSGSKAIGSSNEAIRATVRGTAGAVTLAAGKAVIEEWGKSSTIAHVVISNTTTDTVTLTYSVGPVTTSSPTVSIVSCPSSIRANEAGSLTLGYSDADGDIQTLTETLNSSLANATASADVSTRMTGTSGTYTGTVSYRGSVEDPITANLTYFLTDAAGNQSNVVECRVTITP